MISINHTEQEIFSKISGEDLVFQYFKVRKIPSLISSPFRKDKNPSFNIYYNSKGKIRFKDFSTGQSGGLIDLFMNLWDCSYNEALNKIGENIGLTRHELKECFYRTESKRSKIEISCKLRLWNQSDIDYWKEYGISKPWLEYANVHPISHFFIKYDEACITYKADELAYGFYEFKEGKTTVKIYQPKNKNKIKWRSNHDHSVISLWTKIPKDGKAVCICSSLKDALCLWENTGIPSIAIQGESCKISDTVVNELKLRFKNIFICLDNDNAGIKGGERLSSETGFINITLPQFEGGKDISDYYKSLNDKNQFKINLIKLFKDGQINALSGSKKMQPAK